MAPGALGAIVRNAPPTTMGRHMAGSRLTQSNRPVLFGSNQTFQQKKSNLIVNGHPIPDQLVKIAEKIAGPIKPGDYWYDFRAGFWGVMGGRALGMIPPFIQEFNYPMPAHCAGGNTGIFVNGRELHHIDLDMLHGRGFPTDRGKSYTIEMSGRVLDEQWELYLGKLAPTVEKMKRGFGMRTPPFMRFKGS
ncbi:Extra-large guanine nucleotide-binding protein 2 [Sesamum angolense]|uniref:Extra-large guanine nucleotide-binding protein 2 n=1 Tax=Sesamum angolense TaxID=2727404 RepID=A0AAE1WPV3_9LAMI|nr:Extra-large guanine nucleotide-binding protein 2 [Sesamum angolense]